MKFSTSFYLLNKMWTIDIQNMTIPKTRTKGMGSRVPHTLDFVIFLDFDNIRDPRLKDELTALQDVFDLGDFHVLATNEFGRHAICIDRMPLRESLEVIYASSCDTVYRRGIKFNETRTWILRTEPKGSRPAPTYLYTVESEHNGKRLQSQAHAIFLEDHYGAKVRLPNPDGLFEIELQDYNTASHVDVREFEKKK